MTSNPQWKRVERQIAAMLGGRRVPVTGRTRGDAPDVEHPAYSLEVKSRNTIPGWLSEAVEQAVASARDNRVPVVVVHTNGKRYADALAVVRLADFQRITGHSETETNEEREPVTAAEPKGTDHDC